MAIYTRTGDKGETGLLGGRRTSKGSWQISVIGAVDELNSVIGLGVGMMESIGRGYRGEDIGGRLERIISQLRVVQNGLFEMGAEVAGRGNYELRTKNQEQDSKTDDRRQKTDTEDRRVKGDNNVDLLESWIDEMEKELPELHNFILPGGSVPGAQLMIARAVGRRAEREMVRYINSISNIKYQISNRNFKGQKEFRSQNSEELKIRSLELETMLAYLNRLSDYLFVAGRWVNWVLGEEEVIWKG